MKQKIILLCFLLIYASVGLSQKNWTLTNDVPITDYGIRLALCDNIDTATNPLDMLMETELSASKEILWIIHNASSNKASLVFLGMSNSFDFKLFTTNGVEIPKTAKGISMCAGPTSRTNFYASPRVIRIGNNAPGSMSFEDFPKLSDLFLFPSGGTFILEVRYWGWTTKREYVLSEPVRVRVIKD